MATPPVTLWSAADHECLLCVVEGRREVHLRQQGRTVRLQTVADDLAGRLLADQWRRELHAGSTES